jgi:hypothetical protein
MKAYIEINFKSGFELSLYNIHMSSFVVLLADSFLSHLFQTQADHISSKSSKVPAAPSLHPLTPRPASRPHPSRPLLPRAMLIARQALGLIIDHGAEKLLAASSARNASIPSHASAYTFVLIRYSRHMQMWPPHPRSI